MQYRYHGDVSGNVWHRVSCLLQQSFRTASEVEAFAAKFTHRPTVRRTVRKAQFRARNLGLSDQLAMAEVCNSIVSLAERTGDVGTLMTQMNEDRPGDQRVQELIEYLVGIERLIPLSPS